MNHKSILIIGGGGHSKIVIETALASCQFQKISILDDKYNNNPLQNKVLDLLVME